MKRLIKLLGKNRAYFLLTLAVGIIYCTISVAVPGISGGLVSAVVSGTGDRMGMVTAFLLVSFLQICFSQADEYAGSTLKIRQKNQMREGAFRAFVENDNAGREEISGFVSFVNNDIPGVAEQYVSGTIDMIKCGCIILFSAASLLAIHWSLALIIIGISAFIIVLPNALREKGGEARKSYSESLAKYNTTLRSVLDGLRVVRAYRCQKYVTNMVKNDDDRIVKGETALVKRQLIVQGITTVLQVAKTVLILLVGVLLIERKEIEVGSLVAVVQLSEMIGAPIEVFAYLRHCRNEVLPLAERYEKMTGQAPKSRKIPESQRGSESRRTPESQREPESERIPESRSKLESQRKPESERIPENRGIQKSQRMGETFGDQTERAAQSGVERQEKMEISLDHVSYNIGSFAILKDISARFVSGGKYLITGESGSGKSTLLRLLARISDMDYGGNIYWSGISDGDVCPVFQEPYLFYTTLAANICLGREITRGIYEAVIQKLNLSYLLERYQGQDITPEILEKLSGGERQRIALARAMVGKPVVYLLDEVTSALDESNAKLVERLMLTEPATVIHVCHKPDPELISRYDSRFELAGGRLHSW